jgi:hypothetical protein
MPITVNGQTISDQQIKDFYAQGGNDNQWLQQNGVTDLNQIHSLANQARDAAGFKYSPQDYFKQYQSASPNGAFANDFNGWMNNISPTQKTAIESGTYTGVANAGGQDYGFGGIYGPGSKAYGTAGYGSGLGQNGIGDGWGNTSTSQNLGMGSSGGNSGGYSGGSSGSSSSSSTSGGQNPYLQEMGNTIVNQMTDNYNRNQLPAMRSGAMAAGGFGGSRQGVVEANGLRDLNLGIGQNLTSLYGTDWTNAQNRNLTQQQITNQNNQFGISQDNNNAQFGANYGLNVLNAQNQWAQNGVQATTNMQNTPANYQTMFNQQQNQIAGQGGTSTNTQNNAGNPWLGALGGFQLANQAIK